MEVLDHIENDPPLQFPSLRLFIPPLRLVSGAMWHAVQSRNIRDYGMVEEFISTVTDIVPELLNPEQKVQLLLGLRARVLLELCRPEQITDTESVELHLKQIRTIISTWAAQPCFADVSFSDINFVDQVELILKDIEKKKKFFQDVFPTDFGPDFDNALEMLMLDFVSRLEKLLPVPDIQQVQMKKGSICIHLTAFQTASMLSAVPSALEESTHSVPDPEHLTAVLRYHATLGCLDLSNETQTTPSSTGTSILSSLSLPQLDQLVICSDPMQTQPLPELFPDYLTVKVEEETVTLVDDIQHSSPVEPDDPGESVVEETVQKAPEGDSGDAVESPNIPPPQQTKWLRLRRRVFKEKQDPVKPKRVQKKCSNSKTCPVCNKTFPRSAGMRRHLEIHKTERDYNHKCSKCDKRFRDQYDLKRHTMRVHEKGEMSDGSKGRKSKDSSTPETPTNKTCPHCGKYFAWQSDLKRHIETHSGERPHQCSLCEKKFKNPYALRSHEKSCKTREDKRAKKKEKVCLNPEAAAEVSAEPPDCTEKDSQSNPPLNTDPTPYMLLSTEVSVKHRVCPICSMTIKNNRDIKKHLRSHSEERPYVCVTCEKGFKYKDTIKKHQTLKGHEGIREVQCKKLERLLSEVDAQCTGDAAGPEEINLEASVDAPKQSLPVLNMSKEGLKVCPVCSKTFDMIKTLNKHLQSHRVDRPYYCVHCKRRYKDLYGLKRHQIYAVCYNKPPRYSLKKGSSQSDTTSTDLQQIFVWCSNCSQHFESLSALKEHQESVCRAEPTVKKCNECGKEFKSITMLKVHKKIHNPLYCKDCKKILADEPAFERHKLLHRPMQCTMCEETFIISRRLREHYEKHHNFTGPFPCTQCDKTFVQLSYLIIHQRIHRGEFPFVCDKCPEKFRTSSLLTVHRRKHSGEKPFLCWQCGKSYRAASDLSMHMGTHSEERPWICTQCDMAYRTKAQLKNHVEQVHLCIRFTCATCGRQFMKEMSLKRHELTHTGERPFPCVECSKSFLTGNELLRHSRYHTGVRPYKCEVCCKAFIQSSYLKIHMLLHTGEKPYTCDICDKSFRLSRNMQKHRRTHDGKQKSFTCEICGVSFTQRRLLNEHAATHEQNIETVYTNEIELELQ
ncbi:hypothetical protein CRENBAI_019456 [Crenichthys baileyi]|uniref:C2H2-type domain-containing protein n=1 Tax=Crenichthys baileyi TaxID=28760 RepID=A0AAV9S3P8_9TELE